eukprot:531143-Prymnesium_polylepis.1
MKAYSAATGGSAHRHESMLPTIHDLIPHVKEHVTREGLGKEVSTIVDGANVGHLDHVLLELLAYKEMSSFDMFDPFVVFWI